MNPPKPKITQWIKARLREPSTYAGLATGALAVAEVARNAEAVARTFKDVGPLAGVAAMMSAAVAIIKEECATPRHDDTIIDAEFTEVKKDETE